jgi:tail protein
MIITQFGLTTGRTYRFPERSQVEFSDNFRQIIEGIKAVIGKSGGVDQFGTGPALIRQGEVRVSFWLKDIASPLLMEAEMQAVNAMTEYGIAPLYRELDDGTRQYCMARLSNAPETYTYRNFPEKRMQITLTFAVPDPFWRKEDTSGAIWGKAVWGSFTWGGASYTSVNASGKSTSTTITNNGNASIPVRIEVETSSIQTCQYPTIQRIKSGAVVEQVRWYDTVAASKKLHFDTARHRVTLQGVASYDALTSLTADWLTLEPGSDSLKILFENSTDAATVKIHYQESYR